MKIIIGAVCIAVFALVVLAAVAVAAAGRCQID